MSPWIIGFIVFIVYPMVSSLYFSFTHYDLLSTPVPIGLENYRFMFTQDPVFWQAIRNTVFIIVVGVPLRIVFAIFTATLLTLPRKGIKVYRTIYFLPSMAPPVAAALAFVYVFNPSFGPVNHVLNGLGMKNPPTWFYSPGAAKWALVFLGLWGIGDAMIIFLAGLLDVPRQLYEAADIEGATAREEVPLRDASHDHAGDLLLARDRNDQRFPVLHAGVHRRHRGRRRADPIWAHRRTR